MPSAPDSVCFLPMWAHTGLIGCAYDSSAKRLPLAIGQLHLQPLHKSSLYSLIKQNKKNGNLKSHSVYGELESYLRDWAGKVPTF